MLLVIQETGYELSTLRNGKSGEDILQKDSVI